MAFLLFLKTYSTCSFSALWDYFPIPRLNSPSLPFFYIFCRWLERTSHLCVAFWIKKKNEIFFWSISFYTSGPSSESDLKKYQHIFFSWHSNTIFFFSIFWLYIWCDSINNDVSWLYAIGLPLCISVIRKKK